MIDATPRPVSRFQEIFLNAALDPNTVRRSDVADCEQALADPTLPADECIWSVRALAGILCSRPDLEEATAVDALCSPFNRRLPPEAYRLAAETLGFLLATDRARLTVDAVLRLLTRGGMSILAHGALLRTLSDAAHWRPDLLSLEAALQLAECDHLAGSRDFLREHVIESCIFADPTAVTPARFERLGRLYAPYPAFAYLRSYLAHLRTVPAPTRAAAQRGLSFPAHEPVARVLRKPDARVLVIQNIADGQGDEIIRVVTLVQAFLDFAPHLTVVLLTDRAYLYNHPRLTTVPINDRERATAVLREAFDVLVHFSEPNAADLNHNPTLEWRIPAAMGQCPPAIQIHGIKGYNRFDYDTVNVPAAPPIVPLIARQEVDNVYAPVFRLIAELGLPPRGGEEPPASGSILALHEGEEARTLWARVTAGNVQQRPVALLNPFGGIEPLKGYTRPLFGDLASRIHELIADGYFVVVLPNGEDWGTPDLAREVLDRLQAGREQVAIAPDPRARDVTLGVPGPSGVIRLFIAFAQLADLVVAVEGWMIHVAYCLGKRYRVLMLPYSADFNWHPYGRTKDQRVVCGPLVPSPQIAGATDSGLLAEKPLTYLLRAVLGSLGEALDLRALPALRRATRSEDRALRLAAVEALARYGADEIEGTMRDLLRDPSSRVRAAAARALLQLGERGAPGLERRERTRLEAYILSSAAWRQWGAVMQLGAAARDAVAAALADDDPVVRREAAVVQAVLRQSDGHDDAGSRREAPPDSRRQWRPAAVRRFGRRIPAGPKVLILTPVKDAVHHIPGYCDRIPRLTYPHALLSLGLLESDSRDGTHRALHARMPALRRELRRASLWKRDFNYLPRQGMHRAAGAIQSQRRGILARSRNHLLSHALDDEDWVLWLDVDVIDFPWDIIEQLLATGKDIVQPHCITEPGGRTFDCNAWREGGRIHLDDLRGTEDLVPLDAVGGTMLLVRADLHRDGLVFPPFPYGRENARIRWDREEIGEIETEGLGMMAHDMGYECWGMPNLEIRHDWR